MQTSPVRFSLNSSNLLSSFWWLVFISGSTSWILKAWVCDDAYISFRVAHNFVNGYGLRWNIDERVQVFTNPLWTLLHIPFLFLTEHIFLITLFLSLCFSISAVWFAFGGRLIQSAPHAMILSLLIIFWSDSISDFSTSGLENPLLFFLAALYYRKMFEGDPSQAPTLFFLATLSCLTRMDSILIYLPSLLFLTLKHQKQVSIPKCILACAPILAWLAFCIVYYGFFFPNTLYAKQAVNIARIEYIHYGINYICDFIVNDPVGALLLFFSPALLAKLACSTLLRWQFFTVMLGILLYCVYVVWIGGDFMSGRFLGLPVFVMTIILGCIAAQLPHLQTVFPTICIAITTLGLLSIPYVQFTTVGDQRQIYSQNTHAPHTERQEGKTYSLVSWRKPYIRSSLADHFYLTEHQSIITKRDKEELIVLSRGAIGIFGYYAGPSFLIIDNYALSDPLLSRLQKIQRKSIGHISREIPLGYLEARCTGDHSYLEEPIRSYLQRLRMITSGQLFLTERIKTIIAFQTGKITAPQEFRSQEPNSKMLRNCSGDTS